MQQSACKQFVSYAYDLQHLLHVLFRNVSEADPARSQQIMFKACHFQHSFKAMPTAYTTHSLIVVCLQDDLLCSI